jgi:hypothetical protein
METYIVRIYQRDASSPDQLSGMLEAVDTGVRVPFSSLEVLARLIGRPTPPGTDSAPSAAQNPGS